MMLAKPTRFEFKYMTQSVFVPRLRSILSMYLKQDPYAKKKGYYSVRSIYFDSPDFYCYRQKRDGVMKRKKYRMRFYDDTPYCFFEIKRKSGELIDKSRVLLKNRLSFGYHFSRQSVQKYIRAMSDSDFRSELIHDAGHLRLEPKLFVSYRREAYVSGSDTDFRMTVDYNVMGDGLASRRFDAHMAIVEMKCSNDIPEWAEDMIERFALSRTTYSKYAHMLETCYAGTL